MVQVLFVVFPLHLHTIAKISVFFYQFTSFGIQSLELVSIVPYCL